MAKSARRSSSSKSPLTLVDTPIDWQDRIRVFSSGAAAGAMSELLGARHYSYRFAEECFRRMFQFYGVEVTKLLMPEYYATANSLPATSNGSKLLAAHLIFRSTEEIRLLKPGINIACFAWEFDVLKDTTLPGEHPFRNQKRMLSLCDEVWVPCAYANTVLQNHGIHTVVTIPAPIFLHAETVRDRLQALAHLAEITVAPLLIHFLLPIETGRRLCTERATRLADWLGERLRRKPATKIYLSILNPEDFRKNLDAMLRGFYYFNQTHSDSVLMVKVLTSQARYDLADVISDIIPKKLDPGTVIASDSIVFFNDYLSDANLAWLYRLTDFYVCTSVAEGQNLPLLEAMRHGAVPVSTRNTAMVDYIDGTNAVIIPTCRIPHDSPHLAGASTGKPFCIDRCSHLDVARALGTAAELTQTHWAELSHQAAATVTRLYSFEAVWSLIDARLSEIATRTSPSADAA